MIYCWDSFAGVCISDVSLEMIRCMFKQGKTDFRVARFGHIKGDNIVFVLKCGI